MGRDGQAFQCRALSGSMICTGFPRAFRLQSKKSTRLDLFKNVMNIENILYLSMGKILVFNEA